MQGLGRSLTVLVVLQLLPLLGPRREKTCLWGLQITKGTDQPTHSRKLISAFPICKVSYLNLLQTNFQFSS